MPGPGNVLAKRASGNNTRCCASPCHYVMRRVSTRIASLAEKDATTTQSISTASAKSTVALKEWSVACSALGHGEQTVLFRKGGIKEPMFKPQASSFFLFPTSFHTAGSLLQDGVCDRYSQELHYEPKSQQQLPITHFAQLTGAWTTFDPSIVHATSSLHVWTDGFIDSRLKWRKGQPITVLELRTYILDEPLIIPNTQDLWGCFSWVDLASNMPNGQLPGRQAVPALTEEQFAQRQLVLRDVLATLEVQELAFSH